MSKSVCRDAKIILGGKDISQYTQRWSIDAVLGEINEVVLEVILDERVFKVKKSSTRPGPGAGGTMYWRGNPGRPVTNWYQISVLGSDISSHVSGYEFIAKAGHTVALRLHIQADRSIISINGCYPWEVPKEPTPVSLIKEKYKLTIPYSQGGVIRGLS